MTKLLTRDEVCDCTVSTGTGQARPEKCEHGNRYWTERQLNPPERKSMSRKPAQDRKPRPALKRTRRRETAAEKKARLHFNETVKDYPCWFRATRPCERCQGRGHLFCVDFSPYDCPVCEGDGKHRCDGPKDAHHVLPKRFIRMQFQRVLSEQQFVAILFNPKIGAPLCRYGAHEPVEKKLDRIYWEDLSEECITYCSSLPDFVLIELERQCPKRPDLQPPPTNKGSVAAPRGAV